MVKDKSGERVRIREKESNYIRQVAEQYNESFLDALYRIVNYHRDKNLDNLAKPVVESVPTKKDSLDDIDLDMFA